MLTGVPTHLSTSPVPNTINNKMLPPKKGGPGGAGGGATQGGGGTKFLDTHLPNI